MPHDNGLLQEFVLQLVAWVTDSRKVFFDISKKLKEEEEETKKIQQSEEQQGKEVLQYRSP